MCNTITFDTFSSHLYFYNCYLFTHKSFITPAARSVVQFVLLQVKVWDIFTTEQIHLDSCCPALSSQYSSTFELHSISPSGPASSHCVCVCVCVCVCARVRARACARAHVRCMSLLFLSSAFVCMYVHILFGPFDEGFWGQLQAFQRGDATTLESGCCSSVCFCVCVGLVSNLIQDLAAAVVELGWFKVGTRAKEIHVILEREQEEEHRHAVISGVSTRSQPGADVKQDSLVYIKERSGSLVSLTSCSSWTRTHSNVPRGAQVLLNNGNRKMTCCTLNVLWLSLLMSEAICKIKSNQMWCLFSVFSVVREELFFCLSQFTHWRLKWLLSRLLLSNIFFSCQGSVFAHLPKHSWGKLIGIQGSDEQTKRGSVCKFVNGFLVFCMMCQLTFLTWWVVFGEKCICHSVTVALSGPLWWILAGPAPFVLLVILLLFLHLQPPCRLSAALRQPWTLCGLWAPSRLASVFADRLRASSRLRRGALIILVCISGERNKSCYQPGSLFTATPCGTLLLYEVPSFVLSASKSLINHMKLYPQHLRVELCCF